MLAGAATNTYRVNVEVILTNALVVESIVFLELRTIICGISHYLWIFPRCVD